MCRNIYWRRPNFKADPRSASRFRHPSLPEAAPRRRFCRRCLLPSEGSAPSDVFRESRSSVGGLLELDAIEQALNVASNRVGRDDEGRVDGVDVIARDRPLGVTDESGDGDLREPEIVRYARAMAKNVGSDIASGESREDLPVMGKLPNALSSSLPGNT